MWVIAVLLLITFALLVLSKISKTRKMNGVFTLLALAAVLATMLAAWFLAPRNDNILGAITGFLFISLTITDVIARPILKRRVMPPCVRVKRIESRIGRIVPPFLVFSCIAFAIYVMVTGRSWRSFGTSLNMGCLTVWMTYCLVLILFERIEICGDGVLQIGGLQPWDGYESFSWDWNTPACVELRLVSRSWLSTSPRLLVPPQDREAVQQVLEAHLPDLSAL
jgi:hypothetical protein